MLNETCLVFTNIIRPSFDSKALNTYQIACRNRALCLFVVHRRKLGDNQSTIVPGAMFLSQSNICTHFFSIKTGLIVKTSSSLSYARKHDPGSDYCLRLSTQSFSHPTCLSEDFTNSEKCLLVIY
jgi:hypothetical protein